MWQFERAHAAPTKLIVASLADHSSTSCVFLNHCPTLRALSQIFCNRKTNKRAFILTVTAPTLMPRLLTFKAGQLITVGAQEFIQVVFPLNFPLALVVRAPYNVRVAIDYT